MSRLTVAACLLSLCGVPAPADPATSPLRAVIFNNAGVELQIALDRAGREVVTLQSGQEVRISVAAGLWIGFGAFSYEYVLPDHVLSFAGPATIYLQAESDGNLYLVSPLAGFSALPPEQPAGFPLRPANVADRT